MIATTLVMVEHGNGDYNVIVDMSPLGTAYATVSIDYTSIGWNVNDEDTPTNNPERTITINVYDDIEYIQHKWYSLDGDQLRSVKKRDLAEHVVKCIKRYLLDTVGG